VGELQELSETVPVEEIKKEWEHLWLERIDDKVRAECVAGRTFPLCFVDSGTVIVATRDFKSLCLREILSLHRIQNVDQVVGSPPAVGGWRKFSRTVLNKQDRYRRFVFEKPRKKHVDSLQLKKGGRGWIHRML